MNNNMSILRHPSGKFDLDVIGEDHLAKNHQNRIFGPGVPSHFFVYWSIRLQKASNEQQSVYFASPIRKFDPEVIGEGHRAKNHLKSHFWTWCTLSFLQVQVDSLAKGLK